MSGPDPHLERVLAQLREQYLAEAPTRLAELRTALARAATGEKAALEELRLLLHRLAGSGGAYGLDAVSEHARAGELLAYDLWQRGGPPSSDELTPLAAQIQALAAAFHDAER